MTDQHIAREVAQAATDVRQIVAATVQEDPAYGEHTVELTIQNNTIDEPVTRLCADWGLSIIPGRTDTRGDPTHTVVVCL